MSDTTSEWRQFRNSLEAGDPDLAAELLGMRPGLLHERNGLGETVLHFMAVEDNMPAIEWLLKQGSELDVYNNFGTPMIFEVAMLGYKDLFRWLIAQGANPQIRHEDGRSLLDYLVESDEPEMAVFIQALLM